MNKKGTTVLIDIKSFNRKTFPITAIQVTAENMEAVAQWCHGVVKENGADDERGAYVRVKVLRGTSKYATAFPGDWVTLSGNSFKVYPSGTFENCFEPAA